MLGSVLGPFGCVQKTQDTGTAQRWAQFDRITRQAEAQQAMNRFYALRRRKKAAGRDPYLRMCFGVREPVTPQTCDPRRYLPGESS